MDNKVARSRCRTKRSRCVELHGLNEIDRAPELQKQIATAKTKKKTPEGKAIQGRKLKGPGGVVSCPDRKDETTEACHRQSSAGRESWRLGGEVGHKTAEPGTPGPEHGGENKNTV
ncbi:hypothetical protein R1flu_004184 [Riccia fluitans]|uniref:Uncharacterized protein n=1 Tax=Riccia fluitans TaxID=41844 RepID=A0ABD1YPK3_9MARC